MRACLLGVAALFGASATAPAAFAADILVPAQPEPAATSILDQTVVSVFGEIGYRHGIASEFVYDPASGAKVSELNWDHDLAIVHGRVDVTFAKHWSLSAGGWTRLTDDNLMEDRDWIVPAPDWSEYSNHPDTKSDHAFGLDARLGYTVLDRNGFTAGPVAGWRYSDMKWTAYGGSYIYSVAGFRDAVGTFPAGQKGISYEQWMSTPYLGVSLGYERGPWQVTGSVIGSVLVQYEDEDHHWMRDLRFTEEFDNGDYVAARIDAGYKVTPRFTLGASVEYENYFETKGTTDMYLISTGGHVGYIGGDAAGAGYEALTLGLSAKATF